MDFADRLLQRLLEVDENARFVPSPNESYLVFNSKLFVIDILLTDTFIKIYYIQVKVPGMGSKIVSCVVEEAKKSNLGVQAIFVLPQLAGFWRRNGFEKIEPDGNNYLFKPKKKPGP